MSKVLSEAGIIVGVLVVLMVVLEVVEVVVVVVVSVIRNNKYVHKNIEKILEFSILVLYIMHCCLQIFVDFNVNTNQFRLIP